VARPSNSRDAARVVNLVSVAAVVAAVVLGGLLWGGRLGSLGLFGTSNPYAAVETAAGMLEGGGSCFHQTVLPAQRAFARWAGPHARSVDVVCGELSPGLNYARFDDEHALARALKERVPPGQGCVRGSEAVAWDSPLEQDDDLVSLCANLHATIEGAAGSGPAGAPSSLIHELADTPYALPAGYTSQSSPTVDYDFAPKATEVGSVTIQIRGAEHPRRRQSATITYSVFLSPAGARAGLAKPTVARRETVHLLARSVPGFGSFTGYRYGGTAIATDRARTTVINAVSEAAIAHGSVVVAVRTLDAPEDEIPVLRSAVMHLEGATRLAAR
jgi:hypothetical protein